MKKNLLFAAAVLCAFACKPVDEVPVVEVNLSSFGFSAEKNAALKADVFVENPSSSVNITLPYGTDEEALKTLVPTFTVTEGATVTVNDSAVESGVNAVDFTYPVEFLVTVNAKSNALYTVTVKVGEPDAFILAAKTEGADSIAKGPYLAINPKNGEPYFGAIAKTDDAHPLLYRYNGASIVKVCDVTEGKADQPTVAFSYDGTAYFACYDGSKFANVYKVGENSSAIFGEEGVLYKPLTNSTYSTIGLIPLSASSLYIGYGVNAKIGNLAKRTLNLAHTDGKTWQQEVAIKGRNADNYAYETYSKMVGNTGYLLVFNQNVHSLSLYKFDSAEVSTVFEEVSFTLPDSETKAKINLFGIDFDIASDGTPYFMAATENSSALGYSPAVYRYDLNEKKATIVGGVLSNIDANAKKTISFALNSNDIPYVAYTDGTTKNAVYTYIGSKTKVWVDPIALSAEAAENVKIGFAEDGTGYIAYEAAATGDHHIALYKTK